MLKSPLEDFPSLGTLSRARAHGQRPWPESRGRRSREACPCAGGERESRTSCMSWIPVFAGMTKKSFSDFLRDRHFLFANLFALL